MDAVGLIRSKRLGRANSDAELAGLVRGVMDGSIPDYQLSAWLMAVVFNGLSTAETVALTTAFIDSGTRIEWPAADRPTVDKHSTGGVGDKVTLLLLPLLAAAGLRVPKMSGRGLGHTGGTLDKLHSIPGFRTDLSRSELLAVLDDCGCAVVGQSADLVPADKRFYALRDVTDTVSSIPLIAASVISKKVAAGAPAFVLDVKCGRGALLPDLASAREFSGLAIEVATHFGRRCSCIVSAMEQPLGSAVGNALEVLEVLDIVEQRRIDGDVVELTITLAAALMVMTGAASAEREARATLSGLIANGAAEAALIRWVQRQGGSLGGLRQQADSSGTVEVPVLSESDGYVAALDALAIGDLVRDLGGGRHVATDDIDPWVGVVCTLKTGDAVSGGQELARVHMRNGREVGADAAVHRVRSAYTVSPASPPSAPLILETVMSR